MMSYITPSLEMCVSGVFLCALVSGVIEEDDESKQFSSITLEDLVRVDTLGMGGFGRVELVSLFISSRLP